MHRHPASVVQLSLAAWALLCAGAFGATPEAPVSGPKPVSQTIEPIAVVEIVKRADADERFVQKIVTETRQPDPADKLVAPLEALGADIRKLSETFNRDKLLSLPAMELESLERYWGFYDNQLAVLRGELQRITAHYSEVAADLAKRRAAWEATRTAAASTGLPAALIERTNAILAEVARAEEALSDRLDSQLKLASRGNSVQAAVDSDSKAVHAASEDFDRRLLVIDAPPFSDAWSNRAVDSQVSSTMSLQWTIQNEFLAKYYAAYAWKQRALGVAALVLLALLLRVSRRSGKLASHEAQLQSTALVLQRPISSWLVVVLLGVLYFDQDAPLILQQSALLLAPIPVLRLLPRRGDATLGRWPYVVTALYLLYQLSFLLAGAPLLERLHLLLTGALTLAALISLLLPLRNQARTSVMATHPGALRAIGCLFVVGILVGMIANAVGNVSLAEALTRGVVVSSYVGLVLYAANAVLDAILKLLLARPAESGFRAATQHTEVLLQSLGRLLNIAALAVWVVVTLKSFRVYRPVAAWVLDILRRPFELGQIPVTLGGVLLFLVSVWVSLWFAKVIRIVLRDGVLPNIELPHGASNSISTLTYYAVATIGLTVALGAAGFQLNQLTIVVGALSVGIGFGLQNVVNNFVSGNVGVAHGSDLKRVLEILMNAATTTPGLAQSPAPSVTFVGIGASSLNFGISAWTNDFGNWGAIRSDMTVRVYDALSAADIEIPFPQQDLRLRSISPDARAELAWLGPRPRVDTLHDDQTLSAGERHLP